VSERYQTLRSLLQDIGPVAIAFSGGVDSALVAAAAADACIETIAITVLSPVFAAWQRRQAVATAKEIGIRQVLIETDVLPMAGPNRCYRCKQQMADLWTHVAADHGFSTVVDGVTAADLADPAMPGARAATEAGILHPLADLGFPGEAIRDLARHRGLSVWNTPSEACLASRLPSDEQITEKNLQMIENAEAMLREITPRVRARKHGDLVRIAVPPELFKEVLQQRERIASHMHDLGFRYVTLDIQGYRQGGMHPR
jgi:uncharacterized protein